VKFSKKENKIFVHSELPKIAMLPKMVFVPLGVNYLATLAESDKVLQ